MTDDLEKQRLDLDSRRAKDDHIAKLEELRLREKEIDVSLTKIHLELKGVTAPRATVYAAVATLIGGLIGAVINGVFTKQTSFAVESEKGGAAINLERAKFETGLILKAIEAPDQPTAVKTLKFFAEAGLIPHYEKNITELAEKDKGASIPYSKPPTALNLKGGTFNFVSIGISDYGERAGGLRLKFANKDARDIGTLFLAQGKGGLYKEVHALYLGDQSADRKGIFEAFDTIANISRKNGNNNFIVIYFSGVGTTIDGRFYLVTYGADSSTDASLKASALSLDDFLEELSKLTSFGRILVLLDTCYSGLLIRDGNSGSGSPDIVKNIALSDKISFVTSSTGNEVSEEGDQWNHGAFTKVLLDALNGAADASRRGVISMSELTQYISNALPALTNGRQHPKILQLFDGDIFVVANDERGKTLAGPGRADPQ